MTDTMQRPKPGKAEAPNRDRTPGAALGHLPTRELDEPGRLAVSHGRALPVEPGASGDVALLHAGRLVAVARADDGWLRPSVVLGTP